ncbi:MAG: asparagine synthase (glutamine-hydrolyzing) [Gammaproteobacteria bacterium GWE2_42_36]|nr:MAG: asparagine synthase (glutamine-hydrolyzing) [Gammaproteobacteria bacterium GWE2_42_36]
MCGIAGIVNFKKDILSQDVLTRMLSILRHRGPDDEGIWHKKNIALGHVRLSIRDLSAAGHQPMLSFDRKWVIVFNGEIYNYKQIKRDILQEVTVRFSSDSDTEVLVNAIALWGVEETLIRCVGMFAFAAYRIPEQKLYLARDRFGEKPLYYGIQNNTLAFTSELNALKPMSSAFDWRFEVDDSVLAAYFRWGYVPAPASIFKDIFKLKGGHYLIIDHQGHVVDKIFWNMREKIEESKKNLFAGSLTEAVDLLKEKLQDIVTLQEIADVPVGAFLSGGVDSSIVVAVMQSMSNQRVKTFSIGFHEKKYNEASFAKEVAKHLRTDHTEIYLSQAEAMLLVPKMADIYDEPFGDSSQLPTFLVSEIAKRDVSVAISGDGGDEVFGGYPRYLQSESLWDKFSMIPNRLKPLLLKMLQLYPSGVTFNGVNIGDKLKKLAAILGTADSPWGLYFNLISSESKIDSLVLSAKYKSPHFDICPNTFNYREWMMFLDAQTGLQDGILVKVDRASMAVSLETRAPLLDHTLFEFAWHLPMNYKICNGKGKVVLKELLYRYLPKQLIDRPKKGFGFPCEEWLRGGLKQWAEELLCPTRIAQQGFLNGKQVAAYWREHLSGKRNWQAILWNILMFQSWLARQGI